MVDLGDLPSQGSRVASVATALRRFRRTLDTNATTGHAHVTTRTIRRMRFIASSFLSGTSRVLGGVLSTRVAAYPAHGSTELDLMPPNRTRPDASERQGSCEHVRN